MIDQFLAEAPRFYSYYNLLFLGQAALNTLLVAVRNGEGFIRRNAR